MTDFQIGLLVVGVLAIVGVLVYNRAQESSARRRAQRFSGAKHRDVLLDPVARRREPTLEPQRPGQRPASAAADGSLPDARMDYVIEVEGPAMPAAAVLEQWEPIARRFSSRSILAASDGTGAWQRLLGPDGSSRTRLRAALQLVTRAGTVSEGELIEFRSLVETMASKLGAAASAPQMKEAMDAARELDSLCMETDVQIALHLVAPAGKPFAREMLNHASKEAGLEADDAGRLAHRDSAGRLLYVARERDENATGKSAQVEALTLLLDVPRVVDVRRVYESMARCARHLASLLGGQVVDDNGRQLDEQALAVIEAELVRISQTLEARGFAPGGPLALRLFS